MQSIIVDICMLQTHTRDNMKHKKRVGGMWCIEQGLQEPVGQCQKLSSTRLCVDTKVLEWAMDVCNATDVHVRNWHHVCGCMCVIPILVGAWQSENNSSDDMKDWCVMFQNTQGTWKWVVRTSNANSGGGK